MGANASKQEKRYDPRDSSLTFVDREDDLDFLCEGFKSRRALMSCGHAVTPTSLSRWCRRLLDQGQSRFVCGQNGCNVEWSYAEVCKMALLTPEEIKYFETTMTNNTKDLVNSDVKLCPGCKLSVVRKDSFNLSVCCSTCTAKKGRTYDFCWQCLREWKGPAPRSDCCDNDGCSNESVKTLRSCPDITIRSVKCPSIRACPTCGLLLQHDSIKCPNVRCPRCNMYFCFVCLELRCVAFPCSVVPRQTSIPVWPKK